MRLFLKTVNWALYPYACRLCRPKVEMITPTKSRHCAADKLNAIWKPGVNGFQKPQTAKWRRRFHVR